MEIIKTKEMPQYTKVLLKSESGEHITLEIFKDSDIIRINSGLEDKELVVKPRTTNEIDIKLV